MTATLPWICSPPDHVRAAIEASARRRRYYGRDPHIFDIDTLFWGAVIFLALFLLCFLAWKVINGKREATNSVVWPRPRPTQSTAEGITEPYVPGTESPVPQGFNAELGDGSSVSHMIDIPGFSELDEEEFLLANGPRKVRKAIKERRRAREQAQKKQPGS
jgi:hypothetical protein